MFPKTGSQKLKLLFIYFIYLKPYRIAPNFSIYQRLKPEQCDKSLFADISNLGFKVEVYRSLGNCVKAECIHHFWKVLCTSMIETVGKGLDRMYEKEREEDGVVEDLSTSQQVLSGLKEVCRLLDVLIVSPETAP